MIKILFMGRKPVAAKCLAWLLNNEHVQVVGVLTDSHLTISPTKDIAVDARIPVFEFTEALNLMKEGRLSFDLGVSMLYWRKLKDDFLSIPKLGVINFHPAPLPEYKGTGGYNLAILESLDVWAATAHYMDEDIDTGGIVKVDYFPICPKTETAKSLEEASQAILYKLFIDTIASAVLLDGLLPSLPNVGGHYLARAEMESMKEIKEGDDIPRKIRAFWFPPYNGAYIIINEKKYTLIDDFILSSLADLNTSNLFTKASS